MRSISICRALLVFCVADLGNADLFVIRYRRRSPYEIPRPVAGSHKLGDDLDHHSVHDRDDDVCLGRDGLFRSIQTA